MLRSPPTLPVQLCEQVLDRLGEIWHRETVFYTCCLVCHAWLPRSRLHLYNAVILHPANLTKFVRAITLHPFNGHRVRYLMLADPCDGRDQDRHKLSLVSLQLPQLLPNLQHIWFSDMRLVNLHLGFFAYMSRFKAVHSIALNRMRYPTIIQLARYVTAFSRLSQCQIHLTGLEYEFQNLSFPGTRLPTRRIAIRDLSLTLPPNLHVVGLVLDIFSSSSIHSLRMSLDHTASKVEEDVDQLMASFVMRCGDSLTELSLEYDRWKHLDFSHNTRLAPPHLFMDLNDTMLQSGAAAAKEHPSVISRILSGIRSEYLKEPGLTIAIWHDFQDTTISLSGWDALDATFVLPTFGQVERMLIRVQHYSSYLSERTLRQLLPRLAVRLVADFSLSGDALRRA